MVIRKEVFKIEELLIFLKNLDAPSVLFGVILCMIHDYILDSDDLVLEKIQETALKNKKKLLMIDLLLAVNSTCCLILSVLISYFFIRIGGFRGTFIAIGILLLIFLINETISNYILKKIKKGSN